MPTGSQVVSSQKVSVTILDALVKVAASDEPLERRRGGFWKASSAPAKDEGPRIGSVPDWYLGTTAAFALEARGLLARRRVHPKAWRDEREITPAGRELVAWPLFAVGPLRCDAAAEPPMGSSCPTARSVRSPGA